MPQYTIGDTPQQVSQYLTQAALLSNSGATTLYLDDSTSVGPDNAGFTLPPFGTLAWKEGVLFAVSAPGTVGLLSVQYNAGAVTSPVSVIEGPIDAVVTGDVSAVITGPVDVFGEVNAVVTNVVTTNVSNDVTVNGAVDATLTGPVTISGPVTANIDGTVEVAGDVNAVVTNVVTTNVTNDVTVNGAVDATLTGPVNAVVTGAVDATLTGPITATVSGDVDATLTGPVAIAGPVTVSSITNTVQTNITNAVTVNGAVDATITGPVDAVVTGTVNANLTGPINAVVTGDVDAVINGPVAISGGVLRSNNGIDWIMLRDLNTPSTAGPIDVSKYASIICVLDTLGAGGPLVNPMAQTDPEWSAANVNYFRSGDTWIWDSLTVNGVVVFDVKGKYLKLPISYGGSGNVAYNVYGSTAPLKPTYTDGFDYGFGSVVLNSSTALPAPINSRGGEMIATLTAANLAAGTQIRIIPRNTGRAKTDIIVAAIAGGSPVGTAVRFFAPRIGLMAMAEGATGNYRIILTQNPS